MNASRKLALRVLLWTVGLVVLWQSWLTFHSSLAGLHTAGHPAALAHIRLVLSAAEIVAAILFLAPPARKAGGTALLVIFALAIVIHLLHGDAHGLEVLAVYGAAVWVCLVFADEPSQG